MGHSPTSPTLQGTFTYSNKREKEYHRLKSALVEHMLVSGGVFLKTWKKDTRRKINMEPTNHPFGKENDLPNLHTYVPCLSSGVYKFSNCKTPV